ncbi:MAG TPA: patatin-like phospholipase family protein [Anaerolineales bacterium]|nr:patatin-like phospholipase family protein [Anaerolineales bacterium]
MEVTVALGGGGVRGLAHIGVLRVLEREGVRVRGIAGTSMGGVVAAAYAAGIAPDELLALFDRADWRNLFRSRPGPGGMLGLDRVERLFREHLGSRIFAELRIPLAITATDLQTGRERVLTEGDLVDSLMATIALPGIFPPREFSEARFVDGGMVDPVPVAAARRLFRAPVVAVALSPPPEMWDADHSSPSPLLSAFPVLGRFSRLRPGIALTVFLRALEISARAFTELRLEVDRPEVIVRPAAWHLGLFDRPSVPQIAEIGAEAMERALPSLKKHFTPGAALRRGARRLFQGNQ